MLALRRRRASPQRRLILRWIESGGVARFQEQRRQEEELKEGVNDTDEDEDEGVYFAARVSTGFIAPVIETDEDEGRGAGDLEKKVAGVPLDRLMAQMAKARLSLSTKSSQATGRTAALRASGQGGGGTSLFCAVSCDAL